MATNLTDAEIREFLQDIDLSDEITVSSWEAEFIDKVVYNYHGELSEKQRKSAKQIIDKYLEDA